MIHTNSAGCSSERTATRLAVAVRPFDVRQFAASRAISFPVS